jgi:hypothetical protein
LKIGVLLAAASGFMDSQSGHPAHRLLTYGRIQPDVIAHVCGKYAGQAHTCVHTWTRRDGLVGFKSRHPDHQ